MAAVIPTGADNRAHAPSTGNPITRVLWHRTLPDYPETSRRVWYLAIVVAATIVLYYELYVPSAVSTTIIASYHISFSYFVYITVVGNAVGAFSSLVAGLADRWGRANLVVYGLGVTGVLVLFGIPNAPNGFVYALLFVIVGFVEGIVLVATPALVRDFSPQLGRASAMGFWTLGPVVGSLVVSEVSSHTLNHLKAWQDQFVICGIVGLVMFVIALFGLRELSPGLRDQLMVSMKDKALIQARAAGTPAQAAAGAAPAQPWRQMMRMDVLASAFGIAVFLIIYYTAVGFFPIYLSTIFGFSLADANGIGNWFWGFNAIALIIVGVLSDAVRVRKPFMLAGGIGAIVFTIIFLGRTSHPHTGYYTFVWIITLLAIFMGIAYAPWMASFTETVEKHNPALIATGLAVWGWIVRIVVAVSIFVLPFVVTSMTPLVENGTQVATLSAKYAPQLSTIAAIDPATLAALSANPADQAAGTKAVGEIVAARHVGPAAAVEQLRAINTVPKSDLAYLQAHGPEVAQAAADTPGQWRVWWWVCVGAEAAFVLLIALMAGRWSPRRAREDVEEHNRRIADELASLDSQPSD